MHKNTAKQGANGYINILLSGGGGGGGGGGLLILHTSSRENLGRPTNKEIHILGKKITSILSNRSVHVKMERPTLTT